MDWRLGYHRVIAACGSVPRGVGHFEAGGTGIRGAPERRMGGAAPSAGDDDIADQLLYIGISRAVLELVVIAPSAIGERLGLCE